MGPLETTYRRLCADLDLQVAWAESAVHFDGRTVHLPRAFRVRFRNDPGRVETEVSDNLSHEIGHWLAAAPEQRSQPNWGLGISYSDVEVHTVKSIEQTVDTKAADLCEGRASALGLLLRRRIEGNTDALNNDFRHQSWYRGTWGEQLRAFITNGIVRRFRGVLWPAELLERSPWLPDACAELRARGRKR